MRRRRAAVKINRRSWSVELVALKEQISDGSLLDEHRAFIERVLPGFCDFAAGKTDQWRPNESKVASGDGE